MFIGDNIGHDLIIFRPGYICGTDNCHELEITGDWTKLHDCCVLDDAAFELGM